MQKSLELMFFTDRTLSQSGIYAYWLQVNLIYKE